MGKTALLQRLRQIEKHWLVLALLGVYTLVHLAVSMPQLTTWPTQIHEETVVLQKYLVDGEPMQLANQRQYGPVFLAVMVPFLRLAGSGDALSISLLIFAELCILLAFWVTYRAFAFPGHRRTAFILLAALWFNCSALYYILGVRNVEAWELLLLALAFFGLQTGKRWLPAIAIAAATLIKLLPGIFFLYFLIRDRRIFWRGILVLGILLGASHLTFGPQLGIEYLPRVAWYGVQDDSYAVNFYENNAIKGAVVRLVTKFERLPENRYFFAPTTREQQWINHITLLLQAVLVAIVAVLLWQRRDTSFAMEEFGLISAAMLLVSPHSGWEYATLLLIAFSIGGYHLLAKHTSTMLNVLFGSSYILLVHFFPFHLLFSIWPFSTLFLVDWGGLDMLEAYKASGLAFVGFALLFIFFAILTYAKSPVKESGAYLHRVKTPTEKSVPHPFQVKL